MDAAWPRGRLITIEGVEGAGKSTQMAELGVWLGERGLRVVQTAEPDGTGLGLRLRALLGATGPLDPLAECLLFVAARAQHVRQVIEPALAEGAIVLCDRFTDSTLAYQGYGRGLSLEVIAELNGVATGGLTPDLTLVLDLNAAEGLGRARARRAQGAEVEDPFEAMGLEFHERVRKGYWAIRAREPGRVVLVEGERPVSQVAADIRAAVSRHLERPA